MLFEMQLLSLFEQINQAHFDGFLDPPVLKWNSRLRSSAGRFIPGSRKFWTEAPPTIEIASYLLEEQQAPALIVDTLGHEMIHYWLWMRHKPYGHTDEFYIKMRQMGVSRYNTVPRARPYRYVYRCSFCHKDFHARKRLGALACARCCKEHAGGRFDPRFKLYLHQELNAAEGLELALQKSRPLV